MQARRGECVLVVEGRAGDGGLMAYLLTLDARLPRSRRSLKKMQTCA